VTGIITDPVPPADSPVDADAPGTETQRVEPAPARSSGTLYRLWRGPETDPEWVRPAFLVIVVLTGVVYTWNLGANDMGNTYYAAAVKSGTESWKAFLFGAIDPGAFITVDKPPMALWVMELSGRVFGFSSWSMLLPEALAGVASVAVVWRLVKRWMGPVAAVIASSALALTPVAVLMFRINDPDALLTLLMLLGLWGVSSAIERDRALPLALAGTAFGCAFLTKTLAAMIVVPPLALVYLVCANASLRARVLRLLVAGAAFLVTAGWWVALVELWPASSRPFIGGSTNNSELDLIFGYNGLSRVTGNSAGGPGGGGGPNFGGQPGWLRMFNSILGGQISWLLPLAAVGLVAGLVLAGRAPRTDRVRTGFLLWGGFALSQFVVFSLASGIFHPYYTVALAPGVAALVGGGVVALWRLGRRSAFHAWLLPAAIVVTALWAERLLARTPTFAPWLRTMVIVGGIVAAVALGMLRTTGGRRTAALVAAGAGVVVMLAGPAAYALDTVATPKSGPTPSAGPAVTNAGGIGGRFGAAGGPGGGLAGPGGAAGNGAGPGGFGPPGGAGASTNAGGFAPPGVGAGSGGAAGGPGGGGAGSVQVDQALISYLEAHQGSAKYLVAAFGSQSSAPIIIATGKAVVTIGGFNGSDPYPSLTQFIHLVETGQVRYVLLSGGAGGGGGPGGLGGNSNSAIRQWVEAHGTQVSYGSSSGATLYEVDTTV
jgi:4-amino-4-deoxy-L-arabinose transferase-like glycosyltransferase